jgi:3-polyprenyl-4-hydroxybenzoate decarboxylase
MTYSSTLALGRQQNLSRGQNSVSFRGADKRLGPVSNTIVLIVLACLLGLLYLTQVTRTNSYGYQINSLQQQQTQLQQQHEDLTVAYAREQSVARVASSSTAQSMTPIAPSGTVN